MSIRLRITQTVGPSHAGVCRVTPHPASFRISHYDELTQFYTRMGFIHAAESALERAGKRERWACLLSLEIQHLDVIEGALGHEAATRLLLLAARCLRETFQHCGIVGRTSPPRFAVLLLVSRPASCNLFLDRLMEVVHRRNLQRRDVDLSLLGGFSQFDSRSGISLPLLLEVADRGLQAAADGRRGKET